MLTGKNKSKRSVTSYTPRLVVELLRPSQEQISLVPIQCRDDRKGLGFLRQTYPLSVELTGMVRDAKKTVGEIHSLD